MKIPLWVSQAAREFWQGVGCPEPFPRTLRHALEQSPLDVSLKEIVGLTVQGAATYLARLNVRWPDPGADRPLCACLAACTGAGFVLVDAGDAPEERTFSLAHELAHFLRHYWQPRQRARRRLGARIVEVLDGKRPATPDERLHGLLAGVPLGLHVHLMVRGPRRACSRHIALLEEEADRLAYELLAPAAAVLPHLRGTRGKQRGPRLQRLLSGEFGMPAAQAAEYSRLLLPTPPEDPLLRALHQGR